MRQQKTETAIGGITLSAKDKARRELVLNGNMWRVMLGIGTPLALFQMVHMLYRILDTMMASHIGSLSVSAVAYLGQIQMMITALGGGLAVGGSIKISAAYGAGDYKLVKQRVSTLLAMCGVLSALVLSLVFFVPQLLKIAGTPQEFMAKGVPYFVVSLFDVVIVFFNSVYIAIERARGNSHRILYLNLLSIAVKLCTTAYFVYGMQGDIVMIAVASLLSDLVILCAGVFVLLRPESVFGFSFRAIGFKKEVAGPMVKMSFPVIVEKVAFQLGKVVVNHMATGYGATTVGALGISNNLGGITTSPQMGYQEGGASIISQNLGAGKVVRAIDAFRKLLAVNVLVGLAGVSLTVLCLPQLTALFAANDEAFKGAIFEIYSYEAIGTAALGVCAAVTGMLYGFGFTRLTLVINICRVFVFRIPLLWALRHFTTLGSKSVGLVMLISNVGVSILAAVIAAAVMRSVCLQNKISFWKLPQKESSADNEM